MLLNMIHGLQGKDQDMLKYGRCELLKLCVKLEPVVKKPWSKTRRDSGH